MKTKNVENAIKLFNSNIARNKQIAHRAYKDGDIAILKIVTDKGYSKGWVSGGNNTDFEFNIFERKTTAKIFFMDGSGAMAYKKIIVGKEKDLKDFQSFVTELEKIGY